MRPRPLPRPGLLAATTLAALAALATLAPLTACSSLPERNAHLEQARADYRGVRDAPRAQQDAGPELRLASDALDRADAAFTRHDDTAVVDHLAYLASQRSALAQEALSRKEAEAQVAQAGAQRDQLRLAARTREADSARQAASAAQRDAEGSLRLAAVSQQQADAARRQAGATEDRNADLQAQLRDLNARKTDRGMVVTLGDLLFDTGKSELKPGGVHTVEKLGAFLRNYPARKAMVEGFTDNVGSDAMNQALSARRAEAVRSALLGQGIAVDRIRMLAHGEAQPVAGNETSGGRQLNRRVEVVLSDDQGMFSPP